MNIVQIVVIAIFGVVSAIVLKQYKPEFSTVFIIVLAFFLLGKGLALLDGMRGQLEMLQSFYLENRFYYRILFKILGITYLCEFASGICKDAGYQSISIQVELLGKLMILVSAMPILVTIIELLWKYEL